MATPPAANVVKRQGASHEAHPLGFNLAAIAVALGMGGLALAYGIDALGTNGRNAASDGGALTLTRTLGGKDLEIPLGWFRNGAEGGEGFAKQIDLTLAVPLGPNAQMRSIEVTLLPRSKVRPSASLLDGVYLHQFMPEQLSGPPGLVGKPLIAGEGYANETVWYDALSPDPFVAKCMAPVSAEMPARCLRSVYLGPGISAVYAFDADVLTNWRQFDPAIKALMGKIGAL